MPKARSGEHNDWYRYLIGDLSRLVQQRIRERTSTRHTPRCTYTDQAPMNHTRFTPHRRTTYVDAAYSYRPSTVVCLSVCLFVTAWALQKTAGPIEMPFGIWTLMGPRKHVLDRGCTLAKLDEHDRTVHPCAAAMGPYVKLLWPLVIIWDDIIIALHLRVAIIKGWNWKQPSVLWAARCMQPMMQTNRRQRSCFSYIQFCRPKATTSPCFSLQVAQLSQRNRATP